VRTELHFHLLPGVDDGPRDDAEAIELARLAVADGTSRVVVTPHARMVEIEEVPARTARLDALLREAGVALEVRAGGELSPDDVASLSHRELELLAQGPPGQRWLLLEAPLFPCSINLEAAFHELRRRGFDVLVGHPERSPMTRVALLRELAKRGAVLQINASSLTGAHGPEPRRAGMELASSGLPFLLASDAHTPLRPPALTAAGAELAAAGLDAVAAVDLLPDAVLTHGLAAAWPPRLRHGGRSRLGQSERAAPPVARASQVFLDRRRGS
jgi:protein-tyrosine phosphatase